MTANERLGTASAYIAKISEFQNALTISGSTKLEGGLVLGYQTSASTTPTFSAGTCIINLAGQSGGITLSYASPVTGQALFIRNNTAQTVTIGTITLGAIQTCGALVTYDGSAWIKILNVTIS